jgi:hypothetical protein
LTVVYCATWGASLSHAIIIRVWGVGCLEVLFLSIDLV